MHCISNNMDKTSSVVEDKNKTNKRCNILNMIFIQIDFVFFYAKRCFFFFLDLALHEHLTSDLLERSKCGKCSRR